MSSDSNTSNGKRTGKRIKVSAFTQGVTVADLLRVLLEREFPEKPQ